MCPGQHHIPSSDLYLYSLLYSNWRTILLERVLFADIAKIETPIVFYQESNKNYAKLLDLKLTYSLSAAKEATKISEMLG